MNLVTLAELQAAQTRIAGQVIRTPLVPFPQLDGLWLKPESLQVTGAFKLRGAFNKLLSLTSQEKARGVVAHSSGNHAQAVAYAARKLGIPAVVVMPQGAPTIKIDLTRSYGAEVVLVGNASEERARKSAELAAQRGLTPVPPYDDLSIIAGAGSIGLEILADLPQVGTVLVPVSGGGLISGVAAAIKHQNPSVQVIGVEPAHAADAQASLRAGQRVSFSAEQVAQTLADGLRVQQVGALTWPHIKTFVDDILTVTEDEIRHAVRETTLRAHLTTEPSGAVTIAAALRELGNLKGPVVTVLSGGNIDPTLLRELLG